MGNRTGGWFDRILRGEGPIKARTLAFLLMAAGALGFIITLVALDKQTVCLLLSTIVVFGGLSINVLARRYTGRLAEILPEQQAGAASRNSVQAARRWKERSITQEDPAPVQAPAPANWRQDNQPSQPLDEHPLGKAFLPEETPANPLKGLAAECTAILEKQGASVRLDVQHEDRSVLKILSPSGKDWVAMVHESTQEIGVGDLRALYSLMTNSSSIGAFLVSSGEFSPEAQEWAQKRSITLIPANRIGDIVLE